jgi:hypothetical protein
MLPFGPEPFVLSPAVNTVKVSLHKTVTLPIGLCGCETWTLRVREEYKLSVFENGMLRRIFAPNSDGVTGGCRNLHNVELHKLYISPSIIGIIKSRRNKWAGHVARMGEKLIVYRFLVRKPEEKKPLERMRRRWKNNILMDLSELGLSVVDWIGLPQDMHSCLALVKSLMNDWVL